MYLDRRQKLHIAVTIMVMAFIFIHSAMPGDVSGAESNFIVRIIVTITGITPENLSLIVRKLAHFTEFAVLGACLMVNVRDWAEAHGRAISYKTSCLLVWLMGTLYAASDEFHQYFVPDRACSFVDVCIDSAGVITGAIIVVLILKANAGRRSRELNRDRQR